MRFAPYNFTYEGMRSTSRCGDMLHTNTSFGGRGGTKYWCHDIIEIIGTFDYHIGSIFFITMNHCTDCTAQD